MRLLWKIIVLGCILIILPSCSKTTSKGEWVKSKEGVKVYVPKNYDDKYNKSSLSCIASGEDEETGLPIGPFKISVITKDGKTIRVNNPFIPTLLPLDSIRYNYKGGRFSYFAGDLKDKKPNGYAWDCFMHPDSVFDYNEYGIFKKGELLTGVQVTYNDSIKKAILKSGQFKDNKLYLGIRQVYIGDSIYPAKIGVWLPSGKIDPVFEKLSALNCKVLSKAGKKCDYKESVNFAHRYFFWKKYKWWFFIGFSFIGLLFTLCPIGMMKPEDKKEAQEWENEKYRIKPWTTWGVLWRLLLLGLFRGDLVYLRRYGLCSVLNFILWTGIVASSKFIVLYGLQPEYWSYLFSYAPHYWQHFIFIFCIVVWLGSIIVSPYTVYVLNHRIYRHNIYENLILQNHSGKYSYLLKEIPRTIKKDTPIIKEISQDAQDEYNDELSFISKGFSWLTNSKVRHARRKAETLNEYLDKLSNIAENHKRLLCELTDFLNMERKNAYRNMLLAKELVFLIKSGKGNQKKFIRDNFSDLNITSPEFTVLNPSSLPLIDFQDSAIIGFESFDSTFQSLQELGFDDKDNLLISLGIGTIEMAFDSIAQINDRRNAEREHYEYMGAKLIRSIKETEANLLKIHSKMLRANEIMGALSAANEVFVKAYSPLRDYVFGTNTSIKSYIQYILKKHKTKAVEISNEIAYLMTVCNEYNKINISKY